MTHYFRNILLLFMLSTTTIQVRAQVLSLTIFVMTPDSYLIVDQDTIFVREPKTLELTLNRGSHIIKNSKNSFITKKKYIELNSKPHDLTFETLVEIPSLNSTKKRLILNVVEFSLLTFTRTKSYNSKSRFTNRVSKSVEYRSNLEKRFPIDYQKEALDWFLVENKLKEDQELHGFAITENNLNLDVEIISSLMEEHRDQMERYTLECRFRLLDLRLNPLDSQSVKCSVVNNFGRVTEEQLAEKLIESISIYINDIKWKGLLDIEPGRKEENKKFNFTAVKNVSNYIESRKAVVTIRTENGHGSGCLVTKNGIIVTNAHVVKGCDSAQVMTFFGDTLTGKVAEFDPVSDLAILQLNKNVDFVFEVSKSENNIEIGKKVYAIEAPLSPLLSQSITEGIISSELRLDGIDYIQTDAKINGGNSGGALVDEYGNLLGIINAKVVDFRVEGIAFAIPASQVLIQFASYE